MQKINLFLILFSFAILISPIFTASCYVSNCKTCYSTNSFPLFFKLNLSLFLEADAPLVKQDTINLHINVINVQQDAVLVIIQVIVLHAKLVIH